MPEGELDPLIHAPIRLAVVSLLCGAEEAEFVYLRDQVGATDGNLSIHLGKLEEAGYLAVRKKFVDRKPKSHYRLTEKGRKAFAAYLAGLKALLGDQLTAKARVKRAS